jgi:hypothetical protein
MWANRRDKTHSLVIEALRAYGWTVRDTSRVGQGFPDLLIAKRGRTVLVEIKTSTGRLKEVQKVFLMEWPGEWAILTSLDDVEEFNDSVDQSQPVRLTFTGDLRNLER